MPRSRVRSKGIPVCGWRPWAVPRGSVARSVGALVRSAFPREPVGPSEARSRRPEGGDALIIRAWF